MRHFRAIDNFSYSCLQLTLGERSKIMVLSHAILWKHFPNQTLQDPLFLFFSKKRRVCLEARPVTSCDTAFITFSTTWSLTGRQFITAVAIREGTPWATALPTFWYVPLSVLFSFLLGYWTDSLTCVFPSGSTVEHEGVIVKEGRKFWCVSTCGNTQ